jgi:uncharacterized protein (DUF1499 family)
MASPPTKQALRRAAAGLLVALAASGIVWTYRNRKLFTVNDVTTGESFDYPELRAHVYYCSPDKAIDAARRAVESRPDFRLIQDDSDRDIILAEAESGVGNFVDDMVINAVALGPRHTRVIVRSRSRTGRGDLGENARHIRALQAAMDQILVGG